MCIFSPANSSASFQGSGTVDNNGDDTEIGAYYYTTRDLEDDVRAKGAELAVLGAGPVAAWGSGEWEGEFINKNLSFWYIGVTYFENNNQSWRGFSITTGVKALGYSETRTNYSGVRTKVRN